MRRRLYDTICFLGEQFLDVNKLWLNHSNYEKINLKNNLVKDIYIKKNLIKTIRNYQSFLVESTVELNLNLEKKYNIISRVKTPNSIEDKIKRYHEDKYENAKVPICKCLNDMFGARIILEKELEFCEINSFIENENIFKGSDISLKCIDSSKEDYYKATHIYFKKEKDNSVFQWELQIWAIKNANNNMESHKNYKQQYINWENEMIERKER